MRIILYSDFCSFCIHIILRIYIIFADEDWALGYENVPSYFQRVCQQATHAVTPAAPASWRHKQGAGIAPLLVQFSFRDRL